MESRIKYISKMFKRDKKNVIVNVNIDLPKMLLLEKIEVYKSLIEKIKEEHRGSDDVLIINVKM